MPSNLAEAMVKLLADTSNDGLVLAKDISSREHLGNVWADQLSQKDAADLNALPGRPFLSEVGSESQLKSDFA